MIAIGLIPVFLILTIIMPSSPTTTILLGVVVLTVIVITYIGWSMEKKEAMEGDDLLAIPPKK